MDLWEQLPSSTVPSHCLSFLITGFCAVSHILEYVNILMVDTLTTRQSRSCLVQILFTRTSKWARTGRATRRRERLQTRCSRPPGCVYGTAYIDGSQWRWETHTRAFSFTAAGINVSSTLSVVVFEAGGWVVLFFLSETLYIWLWHGGSCVDWDVYQALSAIYFNWFFFIGHIAADQQLSPLKNLCDLALWTQNGPAMLWS